MRLFDTSHYYSDQEVSNYLIEVLPVNSEKWITFNVRKHFSLVLNSSNLRYKIVSEASGLIDLPDGIYEIKQSISPNLQTLSYFAHFRITELLNRISVQRDKLFDDKCSLTREEFLKDRDKLRDIEEYAVAGKWKVEESGDKVRGKELYEWARKQLEKYTNECQC